jgi:hypothetical protein
MADSRTVLLTHVLSDSIRNIGSSSQSPEIICYKQVAVNYHLVT